MAQAARRIVTELHDEPHIEGRRVTVRCIQGLVEGAGQPADEVAEQLDLDIADVYAALHYYHTHPDEIEKAERNQRSRERTAREAGALSLEELRQDRGEESDDVSNSG